jgi:hypothetical protein
VVFFQLLFVLPAMTLAWLEPDRLAPEEGTPRRGARAPLALGLLGLSVATPFLLSLGLATLPVRTTSSVSPPRPGPSLATATASDRCREFFATAEAGVGVTARIGIHAVACWNGRRAYELWGLNSSDCGLLTAAMATVTPERCTRTTAADGSLHFTYRALVRPALLPFARHLTVTLVLARDGRVVRFP